MNEADLNYPHYSRGEDPPPHMGTYMYNPHLNDQTQPKEGEQEDKAWERPKVMDPKRMAYEVKFEKFVMKNLESKLQARDYPEEEHPDFDLSCVDFTKSVNIKAMRHRERMAAEKAMAIEEMFMGSVSHAVPGHDDIAAQKFREENTVDANEECLDIIHYLFEKLSMEATTVDCNTFGSHLLHAEET